ncbi:hypothetical protein AWJ20_623 [Sugiyamaella lignohabitans]|uniref:Spt2p n=1 Tax=Sugiyamaella lignohabitans TaxID=796027 RepID=A0A167D1P8_9ASCO|nr:uncharacterized protein AWJ20_623 [Sugiyamaella lignohabitans]ANB12372.1 hypothetical protein AWJ20_623 [Sugiyamaella lignohabitans]
MTVKVRKEPPPTPATRSREGRDDSPAGLTRGVAGSGPRSQSPQAKLGSPGPANIGMKKMTKSESPKPSSKPKSGSQSRLGLTPSNRSPDIAHRQRPKQGFPEKRRPARRQDDYDESDDDGFIVDDEEEEARSRDVGYDRDEIWSIFNKGRKRQYYSDEDDLSDMEASGSQVFAEEQRSAIYGRREDDMEEQELQRRAEEKRRKKFGR